MYIVIMSKKSIQNCKFQGLLAGVLVLGRGPIRNIVNMHSTLSIYSILNAIVLRELKTAIVDFYLFSVRTVIIQPKYYARMT